MLPKNALSIVALLALTASTAAQTTTQPTPSQTVLASMHRIEKEMTAGNTNVLRDSIDRAALLARTIKGLSLSPQQKAGFDVGIRAAVNQLSQTLNGVLKNGGEYKFLHLRVVQGELRATFRASNASFLNYNDLCLRVDPDHSVHVIDVFSAATGELASQTFRRLMLPIAADADRGLLQRLVGTESEFAKNQPTLKRLTDAQVTRDYAGMHAAYGVLPPALQNEQVLMLLDVSALAHIDKKAYSDALDRYEKLFPDSPSVNLFRIDSTVLHQDWQGTLDAVKKLSAQEGGDPYLSTIQMIALQKLGRDDEAMAAGEAAIKQDNGIFNVYAQLINLTAKKQDWAGTADLLNQMVKNTGKFPPGLTVDPAFAAFVRSQEFADFRAAHPGLRFREPAATAP